MKIDPIDKSGCGPKSSTVNGSNSTKGDRVGYGKPPKKNQFKKGVSGNPGGRPKAKFNAAEYLKKVISEPITVNTNGRKQSMSGLEAFFRRLRNQMLEGDMKAARLFLSFCVEFGVSKELAEGQDRLDELIAALQAGPVPRGQNNENSE